MSEFTTNPWSFEQDVETYASLGVEAIEVCEIKLDPTRLADQVSFSTSMGLTVSSIQPLVRTLFPSRSQPTPVDVPSRMARFRQTIRDLALIAQGVPFVTNAGIAPDGNCRLVLDTAVRAYTDLSDFAAEHGALIALEPLNPTIMNVESSIWTIEQGMALVNAVNRDNFGLCIDFWNIWQNPDVRQAIASCGDRIFVTQVSDWRTPQSFEDRLVPGRGEIPLADLLRATFDAGYRGAFEVEIFSNGVPDALWEGDLIQLIRDCRSGMDVAWAEAWG
jgi:sugar phosphate isomerase/epimerase